MRHRVVSCAISVVGIALWIPTDTGAAELPRAQILETFGTYEKLNAQFRASVGKEQGSSAKPSTELRKEVEAYAEGPFHAALTAAQARVCKTRDVEVLNTLIRVTIATSNSADEAPAWTLGQIFVCQSEVMRAAYEALPRSQRRDMYDKLEFGFENAVYRKPTDEKVIVTLRRKF